MTPAIKREVAIGLRINGSEIFISGAQKSRERLASRISGYSLVAVAGGALPSGCSVFCW